MGEKAQLALELLDNSIWLLIGTVIMVASVGIVENNIALNQTVFGTSIPRAAATLAVPFGWGFSMIRVMQRVYILLRDYAANRERVISKSLKSMNVATPQR